MKFARETAIDAGVLVRNAFKKPRENVKEKSGPRDLVTNTDRASEDLIRSKIEKKYPSHRIIGEVESFYILFLNIEKGKRRRSGHQRCADVDCRQVSKNSL